MILAAGCTGDSSGSNEEVIDQPARGLPAGLSMEGANVVRYDEERIVWEWAGAVGPGVAGSVGGVGEAVTTTFTVPADITVYLRGELRWSFPPTLLGLAMAGPSNPGCSALYGVLYDRDLATCGAAAGPLNTMENWTVTVQSVYGLDDAPFTLRLEMLIPSWIGTAPPAAVVHTTGGRPLPVSAWPGYLPVFRSSEVLGLAFEPTLGVAPDGSVYYLGANNQSLPQLWRSTDEGLTWTDTSPGFAGADREWGSFDPYVHVDPATGRVFTNDLPTPACTFLSFSDDAGSSWTHNPAACGSVPTDHMNVWTGEPPADTPTLGYPRIVYLCYNDVEGGLWCTSSLDGGLTFRPASLLAFEQGGNVWTNPQAPCGYVELGHGATSSVDGTTYVPRISCDTLLIHVSQDGGLTWAQSVVDDSTGVIDDIIDADEAAVAVDAAGNVYYMWVGNDNLPRLTTSTDHGRTWSDAVVVSAPGINATRFPAITAGDAGRVAFLYYGTADADGDRGRWDAYVGIMVDALAPDPVIATVPANDPDDPLHVGACIGRCDGMGDFMDIQHDPDTGHVWVALADNCTPDVCNPHGARLAGADAWGVAAGQVAGLTLRTGEELT